MGKPRGAGGGQYMYEPAVRGGGKIISGTAGNDDLDTGMEGSYVVVNAEAGNDRVQTDNWNSIANGGTGNDTLVSGTAGDFFYGGEGDDRLEAQSYGGNQTDVLRGENGNDMLLNRDAFADMIGGNGRDTYVINTKSAMGTTIEDFKPNEGEVIRLEGISPALAQQLVAGRFDDLCERYNLRLERVNARDVQLQVVTNNSNDATIEIRGK